MPSQRGRDLLLKIADAVEPAAYHTVGAARMTAFDLVNETPETTAVGADVAATYAAGGVQTARVTLQGLFKDSAAEERLRSLAFAPIAAACQLVFPNGDCYAADFLIENYRREGTHDGLESFAMTLLRTGAGSWTTAA